MAITSELEGGMAGLARGGSWVSRGAKGCNGGSRLVVETLTRPSALGMSDPVMEFLEFHEKGKIFWVRGGRF